MGCGGGWKRWSFGSRTAISLGWRIDRVALAQTWPLQLDAMGAVYDTVEDGIADRRIADQFVPARHRNLTGHQQRAFLVAVIDDLQQVASLLGGQRFWTPVVDDQQPGALQHRQHPRQPSFTTGGREFREQPRRAPIDHREAFPAGLVPQCAGQPRLAGTGRTADHQMLAVTDPVATGEFMEQGAVQTARRAEVSVFDHSVLAQSSAET